MTILRFRDLAAWVVGILTGALVTAAITRLPNFNEMRGALGAGPVCIGRLSDPVAERPYLRETRTAMARMMNDMDVVATGDVDGDFVAMMVPHHQGAIDMAVAVLRHGHNPRLKRLAQEIIVTQQEEIAAMRLATGEPLSRSIPSPSQPELAAARQTSP